MFGPAQAAVARAVVDSVESGVIPRDKADDYCIMVGVFIHWDASDDTEDLRLQLPGDQGVDPARARATSRASTSDRRLEDGEASVQPQVGRRFTAEDAESDIRSAVRRAASTSVPRTPPCANSSCNSTPRRTPASSTASSPTTRGADEIMSYGGVTEDAVRDLVHGGIFTRGPKDLQQHRHLHRRHRHGRGRAAAGGRAQGVLRSDARLGDARLERRRTPRPSPRSPSCSRRPATCRAAAP